MSRVVRSPARPPRALAVLILLPLAPSGCVASCNEIHLYGELPNGVVGQPYEGKLTVDDHADLTVMGVLPPGLSAASDLRNVEANREKLVVGGIPTRPGVWRNVCVKAQRANDSSVETARCFDITIRSGGDDAGTPDSRSGDARRADSRRADAGRDTSGPRERGPDGAATVCSNVAFADTFIRNGANATGTYGATPYFEIKGDQNPGFARKAYLAFKTAALPATFTKVELAVTINQDTSDPGLSLAVYGITDNADWDPAALAETAISWSNAPKNNASDPVGFLGQGTTADKAVRLLGTRPSPAPSAPGTVHRIDVTDFIRWALGQNPSFAVAPKDSDGIVTLMLAHATPDAHAGGPTYWARENPDPCKAPRLEVH